MSDLVPLDGERALQLDRVNRGVNRDTRYRTDLDLYGVAEVWAVADGEGDCEDYALAKRAKLLALGWPVEALRLAVCETERGEGHAVLTVDAQIGGEPGTWVLDNRYPLVETAERLTARGYVWIKRQAAGGPGWVEIAGPAPEGGFSAAAS